VTIVAGIDEAGYGPRLGPLVVAATAYRLEDGARETDLNRLVHDRASRRDGLATADSKQLYTSGGSIARIETSTLGHALLAWGAVPVRVRGLLRDAIDFAPRELADLPWYDGRLLDRALPRRAVLDDVLERADHHGRRLTSRGLTFLDLFVAPVLVTRFNRLTSAAGTKAWTLFHTTGRLIERLVECFPDEELVIHVDRQGGRIHYGDLLQTFFPMAPLTTVGERRAESVYRLAWPGRESVRIDFRVKADDSRTPVALASVVAKTVRELFMECLNEWFAGKVDALRPTAGYGPDAGRFLRDVRRAVPGAEQRRALLVRCR